MFTMIPLRDREILSFIYLYLFGSKVYCPKASWTYSNYFYFLYGSLESLDIIRLKQSPFCRFEGCVFNLHFHQNVGDLLQICCLKHPESRNIASGAEAIKKFTPRLGISYLGVRSKIWEPLVTPISGL
jgi:hypothetical protein